MMQNPFALLLAARLFSLTERPAQNKQPKFPGRVIDAVDFNGPPAG